MTRSMFSSVCGLALVMALAYPMQAMAGASASSTNLALFQSSHTTADDSPQARAVPTGDALVDRIHAALTGKCLGIMMGQPVEGWPMTEIEPKAKKVNAWPIRDLLPADFEVTVEPYKKFLKGGSTIAPMNDDTGLMMAGLLTVRRCGLDFTTADVAQTWLDHVTVAMTAECVAMHNLRQGLTAPACAMTDNPYGEWIGSQMRADIWGLLAPGDPQRAAEMARRDAEVTHFGNGIFAAQYIAACFSLAFVYDDPRVILQEALAVIPEHCTYARAIRDVLDWHAQDLDWRTAWERMDERYGWRPDGTRAGPFWEARYNTGEGIYLWSDMHWVHAVPNGASCALAFLWGKDFGEVAGLGVMNGFDCDCNAGTVAGLWGVMHGMKGIPSDFVGAINDTFEPGINGMPEQVKLHDLAVELAGMVATK